MKGSDMSVAHFTMVDYMGEEAVDEIEVAFGKFAPKFFQKTLR